MTTSVYIHIPFCSSICTYCDFAKMYYNEVWVNKYLEALELEIKTKYKGEEIKTLYIGGGTPSSLNYKELEKLISIIKIFKVSNDVEVTFECNIENIDEDKLKLLYDNGINRLSIGVQTFNPKFIKLLGRKHNKDEVFSKIKMIKDIGFTNINVDLMYAFQGETIDDLNKDIDDILLLDIPHISTYSLIIEPNTVIYNKGIKNIDEELDANMYNLIIKRLKDYNHYEVSNFSKDGYSSKHNLTYWNNEHYYGFGLGAAGYINDTRYSNTRNIEEYFKGNYLYDSSLLDRNMTIENEFILGLRKMEGINKREFINKYRMNINGIDVVKRLIEEKKLIDNGEYIYINPKMIYVSNSILVDFMGENYG